jgi:DNA-binding SARP family transcriptional activator
MEVSTARPVSSVRDAPIELRTLGRIDLRDERRGELHTIMVQPKRFALLTYLIVDNVGFHRRDSLLAMFWPESDTHRARAALRQALRFLRRALGDDAILNRGDEEVRINPNRIWSDTAAFEEAVESGQFERACALYPGRFLNGFTLKDAPAFDEWTEHKRGALAARHRQVLRVMAETAETPLEAIRWWRVLATADPYNPRVALDLIDALCDAGETGAALTHLKTHGELVRRELGADPDEAISRRIAALESDSVSSARIRHRIQSAGESTRSRWVPQLMTSKARLASIVGVASLGVAWWVARPTGDPSLVLVPAFDIVGQVQHPDLGLTAAMVLATTLQETGTIRTVDPVTVRKAASGSPTSLWYSLEELERVANRFRAGRILLGAVTQIGDHYQITACLCDPRRSLGPTAVVTSGSEVELLYDIQRLADTLVSQLSDPPRSDLEPSARDQQIRR